MRRSNQVHTPKRRNLHLISCLLCVWVLFQCLAVVSFADGEGLAFDHYDDVSVSMPEGSGDSSSISSSNESTSMTVEDAAISKDELEVKQFNSDFLDTFLYILGGIAGFMMILQITAFVCTKIYPSANRWIEKLKKIGIDGYSDGYVFPTIKILLLGVFSFFCISGYFKKILVFIISWFTVYFT